MWDRLKELTVRWSLYLTMYSHMLWRRSMSTTWLIRYRALPISSMKLWNKLAFSRKTNPKSQASSLSILILRLINLEALKTKWLLKLNLLLITLYLSVTRTIKMCLVLAQSVHRGLPWEEDNRFCPYLVSKLVRFTLTKASGLNHLWRTL